MRTASEGETVACALGGAATFTEVCFLELSEGQLIMHHPDGGFRRFERDGNTLMALDGAHVAEIEVVAEGSIEVAIAGDRYRIPLDATHP